MLYMNIYHKKECENVSKDMSIAFLLDFYKEFLTEKQADVIDLYYNEDLSLAEISEHLGITRQGVRDNIKRGEAVLLDMEQKIGIANRYKLTLGTLESVLKKVNEIEEIADRAGLTNIMNETKKMKEQLEGVMDGI